MFQSYEDDVSAGQTDERLKDFRELLKKKKLDGFYLQRADEFLNEYVPAYAERLAWLTGFTGSTAQAIILADKATLFVDGRYTLQAKNQLNPDLYEISSKISPSEWIKKNSGPGKTIGFDPKIHSIAAIEALTEKLKTQKIKLVPVKTNPVDEMWKDQPAPPQEPVSVHPLKFAGVKPDDKIAAIQDKLKENGVNQVIITQADSIAWLLNIRGRDVPHTPLALSFMIVHASKKAELFIDKEKLNTTSKKHLDKYVRVQDIDKLQDQLEQITKKKTTVQIDKKRSSYWFLMQLEGENCRIIDKDDPCTLPKAIKNEKEIEGARQAHERDGVAMCRFLAWLDENSETGELDEITVSKKLEQCRRDTKALKEISFDTISGAGPNGAIIHYRVTESTNRKLKTGSLYLVDSGGQYQDGTTDITRTIAIGTPTKEMRTRFTQVLKGMIDVSLARFPEGTKGSTLDILARQALWKAGVDYAHGTGHGVGSYLSVHEGPQGIHSVSTVKVQPGMIISNEPGYYKENKFGIRIENLILATEPEAIKSGEKDMMGFETLTLAPIDQRLIDPDLLTDEELSWLNQYHAQVRKVISPHLSKDEKSWLKNVTAAISRQT